MFEEAYDLGMEHGKKGTYLLSRWNPYIINSEEYDLWATAYDDGFNEGENTDNDEDDL